MLVIFLYDYIVPVMSIPTTPVSFKKGVNYPGLSLAGNAIQIVFVRIEEGDKYTVDYKGRYWAAELRLDKQQQRYFQLIEKH